MPNLIPRAEFTEDEAASFRLIASGSILGGDDEARFRLVWRAGQPGETFTLDEIVSLKTALQESATEREENAQAAERQFETDLAAAFRQWQEPIEEAWRITRDAERLLRPTF